MNSPAQARLARDPSEQIAAATRMLVMEEILDYSGHVSARLPGGDRYMVQNASDSRAALEPDRLLVLDLDGNVLEGDARPPLEAALHGEIYRARPDVNAILHCHMEPAIAFTLMKDTPLVPVRARAKRWASGIPTHPDPSLIRSAQQGRELAQTLGPHHAALLRGHGMVLTAESVPGLFVDAVHFNSNARLQMLVMQTGRELVPLTEAELDRIDSPREFHLAKLWNYYVRRARAQGIVPEGWSASL